jgi:hypothetical protein
MTPTDFLTALSRHLSLHNVPHAHGDLIVFVEAAWPGVEEPVIVDRWAPEFCASQLRGLVDADDVRAADLASVQAAE